MGWVAGLWVGGSLASGDYTAGISDLDLVAVVDGPVSLRRRGGLEAIHRDIDATDGAGLKLGCVYVDVARLTDADVRHPTWTHGALVQRALSGISRAELVRYGYPVFGCRPQELLPESSTEQVRRAAREELSGYWAGATRRPLLWIDTSNADLAMTSMARGRHAMATGELVTKTRAIDDLDAPGWLIDQVRARRQGLDVTSPRWRTGYLAWRDARRTVRLARTDGARFD